MTPLPTPTYLPLRVYSVYAKGKGAVAAAELAAELRRRGVPFLAVCDPFSVLAWESFRHAALGHGQTPVCGSEVRLPDGGQLLLFPRHGAGFLSLLESLNAGRLLPLQGNAAVFVPALPAEQAIQRLRHKVGDGPFYLGLTWNTPRRLVEIAAAMGLPLVWAQPLRWLGTPAAYAVARTVFHHLPLEESMAGDYRLDGLLPEAAILARWGRAGREALDNTLRLAAAVEYAGGEPEPPWQEGEEVELRARTAEALRRRRAGPAERRRAERELEVVCRLRFAPYFLIAADLARHCRERGIFFHLRGSGASSYLLYLLDVSRIDPLPPGLLFERFVNSRRDDLPDIDIDIDSSRRSEVFAYVFERYRERVAFVSSHKFFGARSALYETARAAGFSPEEGHALSKNLPLFAAPRDLSPPENDRLAPIYRHAAHLQGIFRELSLHVGGVVFAAGAAARVFPLTTSSDGFPQVVWDKDAIERRRIFKLDLLGVRGFDVIAPVALQGGTDFRDPAAWETIRRARTIGCFQIESPLARENLGKCAPRNLEELAVAIAIIRPGPARSGMKRAYQEGLPALHPLLAHIFPRTRGALIYEEQISRLLHHLTGWDLETAEQVRRTLKKKAAAERRAEYLARGREKGWAEAELEFFWKLCLDFSLYAFCQAHSTAYAYAAYLSAWMKTHRPVTFFCRLLNAAGGYYPPSVYVEEAQRCGVAVLPPDLNHSAAAFAEEGAALRCGLMLVKGVGEKLAGRILESRGAGFGGVPDFVSRTRCNERELSALLAVGAGRSLGLAGFPAAEQRRHWREYLGFLPSAAEEPPPRPLLLPAPA